VCCSESQHALWLYSKRAPHSQRSMSGRGSLIKPGNASSVDSEPRLCETWHCVWAYYWCTVRHSVLGMGQRSLCALPGPSGHLRSEPARSRKVKHSCIGDFKASVFKVWCFSRCVFLMLFNLGEPVRPVVLQCPCAHMTQQHWYSNKLRNYL